LVTAVGALGSRKPLRLPWRLRLWQLRVRRLESFRRKEQRRRSVPRLQTQRPQLLLVVRGTHSVKSKAHPSSVLAL